MQRESQVIVDHILNSRVSYCRKIVAKPTLAYNLLVSKVQTASSFHASTSRLSLGAFADGLLHLVNPRFFSHVLILTMAGIIATVSGIATSGVARGSSPKPWQFEPFASRSFSQTRDFLDKPAVPFTTMAKRGREGIVTYEVLGGDTVTSIAERFGITPETVVSANMLDDADSLSVGANLIILPVTGILHVVRDGDTVESIAIKYRVDLDLITESEYNNVSEPYNLFVGQKIVVPGGKMPEVKRPMPTARGDRPLQPQSSEPSQPSTSTQPTQANSDPVRGGGRFAWPTSGPITQYFSGSHPGLDIAPPFGAPIYASEAGVVISLEYLTYGYGWNLVIDHGDGFTTRYSHLSKFLVSTGQRVSRGQIVGLNGSTGYSTGPHLDFRIYKNGTALDPLKYLP